MTKPVKGLVVLAYLIIAYYAATEFLPTVLSVLSPFIAALIVALIARPIIKWLRKHLKVNNAFASAVSLIGVLGGVILALFFGIRKIVQELIAFASEFPDLYSSFEEQLYKLNERLEIFRSSLTPEIRSYVNGLSDALSENITNLLSPLTEKTVSVATGVAGAMPQIVLFTFAFLIASFFLTKDFDKVIGFIRMQLPESWNVRISQVKNYSLAALNRYIRGLFIMMCIMSVVLFIGFSILGIKYALLLALGVALLDALPILGTGIVLIPWGIFGLLTGNFVQGIGLLLLYAAAIVVRNLTEPKVMSTSLGTHPLVTLASMYIGYRLFGGIGLILTPCVVIVLLYLNKAGVIKILKLPEKEPKK